MCVQAFNSIFWRPAIATQQDMVLLPRFLFTMYPSPFKLDFWSSGNCPHPAYLPGHRKLVPAPLLCSYFLIPFEILSCNDFLILQNPHIATCWYVLIQVTLLFSNQCHFLRSSNLIFRRPRIAITRCATLLFQDWADATYRVPTNALMRLCRLNVSCVYSFILIPLDMFPPF